MSESGKKTGRPRRWGPDDVRVETKFHSGLVSTLDILILFLKSKAENPGSIDRGSVMQDAVQEYLRNHATIVNQALAWYKTRQRQK